MAIKLHTTSSYTLILLFAVSGIFAQLPFDQFRIKQYGNTIDEPFHTAENLRQDSLGRLLFQQGTQTIIYDGSSFNWSTNHPRAKLLLVDSEGDHWYLAEEGKVLLDRGSRIDSISTKSYTETGINSIYENNGNFYLITNTEILVFRKYPDRLMFVDTIPSSGIGIWNLYQTLDTLFVKGLDYSRYFLRSDYSVEYRYGQTDLSEFNNGIFYLPKDRLVLHKYDGDTIISKTSNIFQKLIEIGDKQIIAYLLDSKERLWISVRGEMMKGIYLMDHPDGVFEKVDIGTEDNSYRGDIFEDNQGSIWIGSLGQGLTQIYDGSIQILDKSFGLSSDNIWSITQANNGNIYFSASCSGIDVLYPDGLLRHTHGAACQEGILADTKNRLWVNTKGVTILNGLVKVKNFQKESGLHSRTPKSLFEDSKGVIWVGTRQALHRYENGRFTKYFVAGSEFSDQIFNIVEYQEDHLLLCMTSGRLLSFSNGEFVTLEFASKTVSRILKGIDGHTWIATLDEGLFLYDGKNFSSFKSKTNIPLKIYQIQDDRIGNLWGISEGYQIFQVKKEDLFSEMEDIHVNYLTVNHGLPLIQTNTTVQPSSVCLSDGRLIFPNIHGAILVDPHLIDRSYGTFKIEVNTATGSPVHHILTLGSRENDIVLKLNGISLHPARPIQFQFRTTEDWIDVDQNTQSVTLNNMPNGENQLLIRGRYVNKEWQEPHRLTVYVPTPFYKKWWFRILAVFCTLLLIRQIVKWRTLTIARQKKQLELKVNEQTKKINQDKNDLTKSLQTQKKLTHDLRLAREGRNRMYAQIAHEFKSPLQTIKSHLSSDNPLFIHSDKKRILGNLDNLLGISNEIMELSKAESGNLKAKKNWYNINAIIQDQLELKLPLSKSKSINISFPQKNQKQYLFIDIFLMSKVISNLLSNAIKYSSQNSPILITSLRSEDFQKISIKDQGYGISEVEIPNITHAFYRVSNNAERGTGIGLNLVEQILKLHESRLEISSQLDCGSTFAFKLVRPSSSQINIIMKQINYENIDEQITKIIDPDKMVILVVDDSHDILQFINQTLKPLHYVLCAENGEIALRFLQKIQPDLIISDVIMPIMGGINLLKEVRSFPQFAGIPFIFLTGSQSEEIDLIGIKAGADFVLRKPIEEQYLFSQVNQILSRQEVLMDIVKSSFAHNLLPADIHNDDLSLMQQLEMVILEQVGNSKLKSEDIAVELGIGEKTLRNRVKRISGLTIKEYLKNFRLEKARILIEEGYGTLGEIAGVTGFWSLSYFSKCFKEYFGSSPSKLVTSTKART